MPNAPMINIVTMTFVKKRHDKYFVTINLNNMTIYEA